MAVIALIYERPVFYTNNRSSLRGSAYFDAGDDLGNVSGHLALCVSARSWACFAQHQHIDLGQKVID